jgi:8-oxo-dGTP pyrophosphatase MutT (NUDIX family)
MTKNKKIKLGAGFVIFRKDTLDSKNPLMLALVRSDGLYDLPKGMIEPKEKKIDAAKRECYEECSVTVDDSEIMFEGKEYKNEKLTLFCASTDQSPMILRNPHTGILEHDGYVWVSKKKFKKNCIPYLASAADYFYKLL